MNPEAMLIEELLALQVQIEAEIQVRYMEEVE
jgi:hypothetical protein